MLLEYYGFAEAPFSITPDPRFVYLSERHRDALAHLHYGITQGGGGGFVQLTGEVGTGKTTLCRLLLEQLPETARVALVLNPLLSPVELLEVIAEELRIDIGAVRGSLKGLYDRLNAFLIEAYAQGLRIVVVIDEAQNLSLAVLEQVRLLTNLETPTQKLLQMVLIGQPELRELLARPELRQLAQRITARFHLTPLDEAEVDAYLRHRVAVAGAKRFPFTRLAVKRLYRHSGGVPRLINTIAERALLAGYARDEQPVGEHLVDLAAREVLVHPIARLPRPTVALLAGALAATLVLALTLLPGEEVPAPATTAVADTPLPPPWLDGATLDARLQQLDGQDDLRAATELLRLWAVRTQEARPDQLLACPPILAPGLFCLTSDTSLDALVAAQRPALVQLHSPGGGRDWALLLGADGLRVRLWLGDITVELARIEFAQRFRGRSISVWRGVPVWWRLPTPGDSGADIDWLQTRLTAGRPGGPPSGPAVFDEILIEDLRQRQRELGLAADGLPGPDTLRRLGAENSEGPRLRTRWE